MFQFLLLFHSGVGKKSSLVLAAVFVNALKTNNKKQQTATVLPPIKLESRCRVRDRGGILFNYKRQKR